MKASDRRGKKWFQTKGTPWLIAGLGAAFFGVFDLPWFVPFPGPVKGESYNFGFYNLAGVVALCFSLIPLFIGLIRGGTKSPALSWFVPVPVIIPSWRQGVYEYAVLAVASVVCVDAVLVWNAYLVTPYWGESSYFLSSIDLARLGYKPYTDFQFNYGPAFVYAPIWLDSMSGNKLGIENAYADCVALGFPLGFLCLFIFQRFLNLPDRDRPWILALTFLIWFYLTLGIQYTPLRYAMLPCALAIGSHPFFYRPRGFAQIIQFLAVVSISSTVCFLISPEIGIACAVGFIASAMVHLASHRTFSAGACLVGIGLSITLMTGFSSNYLHGVSSFSSGGNNFPIYPNHANLMLVAGTIYLLPKIACSIWQQPGDSAAPLAASIGSAAVMLLPAALGRCDPGHVLFNELLIFVLLFPALGQIRRTYMIAWGVVFGLAFVVLGQISYWDHYALPWQRALDARDSNLKNPELAREWSHDWDVAGMGSKNYRALDWHKVVPFPHFGDALLHSEDKISAPLGADIVMDRYLKIRNAFIPQYYCVVFPELYTPQDVSRVVDETKTKYGFMLISQSDLSFILHNIKQPPDGSQIKDFMSGLLLYPVYGSYRNKPYLPEAEVAQSLLPDCSIVGKGAGYILVKRPR